MRMYEGKIKEEFMKTVKNKEFYEWMFNKTFEFESKYGKDLSDFNKKEILDFLSSRNMAQQTLNVQLSYISTYINWAIREGATRLNQNPTKDITKEDLEKIAKEPQKVLHSSMIYEIVGAESGDNYFSLKNAQDKLLVYLIFLGVRGRQADQLINLKFEHVNVDTNTIELSKIDPNYEDVRVDDHCIKLVKQAKAEETYRRYQKDVNNHITADEYDLIESGYIFRKSGHNSADNPEVRLSYQGILRRISTISKYIGEHLTMKLIEDSGMTRVAFLLYKSGEELSASNPKVQRLIFDRYGVSNNSQGRWNVVKELKKNIKDVYLNG